MTPAIADTTTMGRRSRRETTIDAARRIASASPTEVPPNLTTITDHRGSKPQLTISSAFNTDAPAAPRTTLSPMATSLMSNSESDRTRPTVTVMPLPRVTSRRGCGRSRLLEKLHRLERRRR